MRTGQLYRARRQFADDGRQMGLGRTRLDKDLSGAAPQTQATGDTRLSINRHRAFQPDSIGRTGVSAQVTVCPAVAQVQAAVGHRADARPTEALN